MHIDEAFLPSVTNLVSKTLKSIQNKLSTSPRDIAEVLRRRFADYLDAAHLPATGDNAVRFLVSLGMKAAAARSLLPKYGEEPINQTSDVYRSYEDQTAAKIVQGLRAPNPDVREILTLVRELVAHAKDVGGPEKERVVTLLRGLKNNRVLKSKLQTLRLPESEQNRLIGFSLYLLEVKAVTQAAITNGFGRFYPRGSKLLTARDLEDLFTAAASMIQKNPAVLARKMDPSITKPKSLISRLTH